MAYFVCDNAKVNTSVSCLTQILMVGCAAYRLNLKQPSWDALVANKSQWSKKIQGVLADVHLISIVLQKKPEPAC